MTPVVQSKKSVALWSLIASFCLAIAKFAAAILSGSLGLLSEAFHSMLDFVATGITLFAIHYADRPADDDHHFGHAKMESVAALIETGMLFGVTGWIVYEAVQRLREGTHLIELSWWIYAVVIASIIIDWNRSQALQRTAEASKSDALAADALHFRADMWSSMAVLIGLALVWWGFAWADSVAALVVAVFVAKAAWGLGKRTLSALLDAAPLGVAENVRDIAQNTAGVLSVEKLRVRPAGPITFVDVVVNVPRSLPSARIVTLQQELSSRIAADIESSDVTISVNAIALDTETAIDKINHIAALHDANIHHIAVQEIDHKLAVSFDLEVDGDQDLLSAHAAATALESAIRNGLGDGVEVESHIEPKAPPLLRGEMPEPKIIARISKALQTLAAQEKQMRDVHNIRIRKTADGHFLHYHCRFSAKASVQQVHDVVDRVENALMVREPSIVRIVAHAEPIGHARHPL